MEGNNKMKIIHIEDFFHPQAGYQVNILAKYMAQYGHEVIIITSEMKLMPAFLKDFFECKDILERDKEFFEKTGVKIIRIPLKGYWSGRAIYSSKLDRRINELRPDVVYVHGNDTAVGIKYLLKAGKVPYCIITDSHMLDIASKNRFSKQFRWIYKHLVTPKIVDNKIVVLRTTTSDYVQRYLGIPQEQSPVISLGTDGAVFYPDKQIKEKMRKQYRIPEDAFVVLYAGKLDEAKGGEFLAMALKEKFLSKKDIVTVIIGNSSGEYGKRVEALFAESENQIIRIKSQTYEALSQYYQMADIAVVPKQSSLSLYDFQACGLPVIAEDNLTNIDRLSSNNGCVFKSESIDDLRKKIVGFAELSDNDFKEVSDNAIGFGKMHDYGQIVLNCLDIIEKEYNRQREV